MIDESIFNTENLEGVPEEVSKELKEQKNAYNVIFKKMFAIKKELYLNELIIGAYKGYNKKISRKIAARVCYNLVNLGILSSVGSKSGMFILNTSQIKQVKKQKKIIKDLSISENDAAVENFSIIDNNFDAINNNEV